MSDTRIAIVWGAHATRVHCLATSPDEMHLANSRFFGESPKTARESRALPRSHRRDCIWERS
jgi:hypothetical protein